MIGGRPHTISGTRVVGQRGQAAEYKEPRPKIIPGRYAHLLKSPHGDRPTIRERIANGEKVRRSTDK